MASEHQSRYRAVEPSGNVVADNSTLLDAVTSAFNHAGYVMQMVRDENGLMVARCSTQATDSTDLDGSVPVITLEGVSSALPCDQSAQHELAQEIYEVYGAYGDAHIKLPILIEPIRH